MVVLGLPGGRQIVDGAHFVPDAVANKRGGREASTSFLAPSIFPIINFPFFDRIIFQGRGGKKGSKRGQNVNCGGRMERLSNSRTAKGANTPFLLLRVGSRCVSFFFRENDSGREGENRVI